MCFWFWLVIRMRNKSFKNQNDNIKEHNQKYVEKMNFIKSFIPQLRLALPGSIKQYFGIAVRIAVFPYLKDYNDWLSWYYAYPPPFFSFVKWIRLRFFIKHEEKAILHQRYYNKNHILLDFLHKLFLCWPIILFVHLIPIKLDQILVQIMLYLFVFLLAGFFQ